MRFDFDAQLDVVEARFEAWELNDDEDVKSWRAEVEKELSRFGRKVDLLINLDGLVVRPAASRSFGEQRAAVLLHFARSSYRFGGDAATRTSVFTTSVLAGADANVYPTRKAALDALLNSRRR